MDEILKFFQDNKFAFDLSLLTKGTYIITVYGLSTFPIKQEFSTIEEMENFLQNEIDVFVRN